MTLDRTKLDTFTKSYIEAIIADVEREENEEREEGESKTVLSLDDIPDETLQQIVADCEKFQEMVGDLISEDNVAVASRFSSEKLAGNDFWQTRTGAGSGFWDGDWHEGERLTEVAKSFGMVWVYTGDDKKIYLSR